ncbi:acetate kinase [Geomonas sp. RF6]|uniref:acetate kinase n=1 Tax=Geomonas sp. RF6 TaxID=2897342 RepID=UPI001E5BE3B3|nr:acetate kinase [Geomonas sp. RF6]UFS70667.1 acetate kinase [Geomonas sp. RF6]
MQILSLNCGSSSLKYQLYDWEKREVVAKGAVERVVVGGSYIVHEVPGREKHREESECPDHRAAVDLVLRTLTAHGHGPLRRISDISAVGHRVVHGGERFTRSVLIDDEVLKEVEAVQHLAPLHNPPNIVGIRAAMEVLPGVPQVAIFDTAFHQTMPQHAYLYPLPYGWYERHGVRRYGFHGTSHLYVSKRAAALLGKEASQCNVITLHIGNGVSHCAIKNGVSIDTSMGLTPLEGALMGTRCGDIDPSIPLFIMQREGVSAEAMDALLNKESGILGITGRFVDRRDVVSHAEEGDERCRLALEMEAYRLRKYIGSYLAVIGSLDAVVFTAGVGEMGAQIRALALRGLEHIGIVLDEARNNSAMSRSRETLISADWSPVRVYVIPTDEELVFTEDVAAILAGTYTDHMNFPYSFSSPDFVRT